MKLSPFIHPESAGRYPVFMQLRVLDATGAFIHARGVVPEGRHKRPATGTSDNEPYVVEYRSTTGLSRGDLKVT